MRFFLNKAAPDVETVRRVLHPLNAPADYDRILSWIGDASLVLLGEASHGTQEFHEARVAITRLLIERKNFSAVAIEGDWPDTARVNRYVQGTGRSRHAAESLSGFAAFPTWMWRNTAVAQFVDWMREYNAVTVESSRRVGIYGLDLYGLHASMRKVIEYLEKNDPDAAREARKSYSCFEEFGCDGGTYAWASAQGGKTSCEEAVTQELVALRQRRAQLLQEDGTQASDEFFDAEQNALLARNAEKYYRTILQGRVASWNIRDQHMAETLQRLLAHLRQRGQPPRVVVWAHNSHIGDARATAPGENGEINLGQLTRERIDPSARLLGFTTYSGIVTAASDWDAAPEQKPVRPALRESYEALFHQTGEPRFFLPLDADVAVRALLAEPRLERAIGVIYRPETERQSHYFHARLAEQFDGIIHLDETRGVEALPPPAVEATPAEVPETFPSGV